MTRYNSYHLLPCLTVCTFLLFTFYEVKWLYFLSDVTNSFYVFQTVWLNSNYTELPQTSLQRFDIRNARELRLQPGCLNSVTVRNAAGIMSFPAKVRYCRIHCLDSLAELDIVKYIGLLCPLCWNVNALNVIKSVNLSSFPP